MAAHDLLPREHIEALLDALEGSHGEPQTTLTLLELSDWISGSRVRGGAGLSASDSDLVARVLSTLDVLGEDLDERLQRPPCLHSDHDTVSATNFVPVDRSATSKPPWWKPQDALWTSPLVDEGGSAWSIRAERYGDARSHVHSLVLTRPPAENAYLVSSLAHADALVRDHESMPLVALAAAGEEGYTVLDFSWRCLLQAEISVLRGERSAWAFPGGLGVECSLWLSIPLGPVQVVELDLRKRSSSAPPDWYAYE